MWPVLHGVIVFYFILFFTKSSEQFLQYIKIKKVNSHGEATIKLCRRYNLHYGNKKSHLENLEVCWDLEAKSEEALGQWQQESRTGHRRCPVSWLQAPSQSLYLWNRGRPSLASAWLSGPAFPKPQRKGCCATELKEKKLFGRVSRVQCLRRCQRRKGWTAGPGRSRRPFVTSLGVYPKVKEEPAKTELCFQTDAALVGSLFLAIPKPHQFSPKYNSKT